MPPWRIPVHPRGSRQPILGPVVIGASVARGQAMKGTATGDQDIVRQATALQAKGTAGRRKCQRSSAFDGPPVSALEPRIRAGGRVAQIPCNR